VEFCATVKYRRAVEMVVEWGAGLPVEQTHSDVEVAAACARLLDVAERGLVACNAAVGNGVIVARFEVEPQAPVFVAQKGARSFADRAHERAVGREDVQRQAVNLRRKGVGRFEIVGVHEAHLGSLKNRRWRRARRQVVEHDSASRQP